LLQVLLLKLLAVGRARKMKWWVNLPDIKPSLARVFVCRQEMKEATKEHL
jgi:hypothetical protein